MVAFTVERYIIVWYPLRKDRLCTSRRSRTVVICLAFTGCLTYSFKTWTSGIMYIENVEKLALCMPYPQYFNFLTAMTGLDSVLTLIIPSVIVIILNIRIIMKIISVERQRRPFIRQVSINQGVKIQEFAIPGKGKDSIHESLASSRIVHVKFHNSNSSDKNQPNGVITMAVQNGAVGTMAVVLPIDRRSRSSKSNSGSPELISKRKHNNNNRTKNNNKPRKSNNTNTLAQTTEASRSEHIFRKCQTRVHVRGHRQNRTARMLIIVSSVFVILKLPTHVFRIHTFIQTSVHDDYSSMRKLDIRWQELFQLAYYLNFAINFFIYSACGRQFRTGLWILYARMERKVWKIKRLFCVDKGAIPIST